MPRPLAIFLDLALVVLFAVIGRASHGEALDFDGLIRTGAPFFAATLIMVILMTLRRVDLQTLRSGIYIWGFTLGLGMIFRVLIGDGTQLAFILVAGAFLALFLIGWRILWFVYQKRREQAAGGSGGKPGEPDPRRSGNPAKRNP